MILEKTKKRMKFELQLHPKNQMTLNQQELCTIWEVQDSRRKRRILLIRKSLFFKKIRYANPEYNKNRKILKWVNESERSKEKIFNFFLKIRFWIEERTWSNSCEGMKEGGRVSLKSTYSWRDFKNLIASGVPFSAASFIHFTASTLSVSTHILKVEFTKLTKIILRSLFWREFLTEKSNLKLNWILL